MEVQTKSTESEFDRDFAEIASNPPEIAVLDVMLRWADPSRSMPVAPEDVTRNPQNAGLRCAKRLIEGPRTRDVKVILYSVLGREDFGVLPDGVFCLVKELDFQNLIDTVAEISALKPRLH